MAFMALALPVSMGRAAQVFTASIHRGAAWVSLAPALITVFWAPEETAAFTVPAAPTASMALAVPESMVRATPVCKETILLAAATAFMAPATIGESLVPAAATAFL